MENGNIKTYQFIVGIILLVLGILSFALLTGSLKFVGIVLMFVGYIYFAIVFYSKLSNSDKGNYKSRTREQILKHHLRR